MKSASKIIIISGAILAALCVLYIVKFNVKSRHSVPATLTYAQAINALTNNSWCTQKRSFMCNGGYGSATYTNMRKYYPDGLYNGIGNYRARHPSEQGKIFWSLEQGENNSWVIKYSEGSADNLTFVNTDEIVIDDPLGHFKSVQWHKCADEDKNMLLSKIDQFINPPHSTPHIPSVQYSQTLQNAIVFLTSHPWTLFSKGLENKPDKINFHDDNSFTAQFLDPENMLQGSWELREGNTNGHEGFFLFLGSVKNQVNSDPYYFNLIAGEINMKQKEIVLRVYNSANIYVQAVD